ncbi:P2X purinoceptor 7-like isoform X2 [Hyla sarda]|nr:P2X purinoceptor 7-like isoform X2 [Hyla sarda]XP_056403924.1 P2X purinoceptor 7-like isoform X2 [Hyla sarda]XP_056403925.1 P2X purinoceptor 7-like isoform X2 [Hyla sarda]XP_056403927.1 P2X purinoceptor 7-like isoform X2 [Hyla sarda]XP_056403928.1 P2X purinoceptor 7-like isoform X2 [Hyla sarda]XP_056403929.1 P2X purinoceptor 7-like isoform X2 [Hyla sarda]XP_056403930.1 P2X purinoceptor 7-like isoform X2 [Hyla sarda]
MERLRKKAELHGELHEECFQNDPEWPTLDDIPQETNYRHPRICITDWCKCKNCKEMRTRDESFCCQEEDALNAHFDKGFECILEHEDLANIRLKENILQLMAEFSGRISAKEILRNCNRVIRKAAYRSYSCFTHGILGPGRRKPIPSCVVNFIRRQFPDPDGHYVGFHYAGE